MVGRWRCISWRSNLCYIAMKTKHWLILMLIEAALLTNPRKSDHAAALAGMYTSGELQNAIGFGSEYVIKRNNYYLFSVGKIGGLTVSYGAFGQVKTITPEI